MGLEPPPYPTPLLPSVKIFLEADSLADPPIFDQHPQYQVSLSVI